MPCQVLDRLGIHSGVDQVRYIRVAEQVRCYREIDGVNNARLVPTLLPEFQRDLLFDGLAIHVFVERPLPSAADLDVVPDPDETVRSVRIQLYLRYLFSSPSCSLKYTGSSFHLFLRNVMGRLSSFDKTFFGGKTIPQWFSV